MKNCGAKSFKFYKLRWSSSQRRNRDASEPGRMMGRFVLCCGGEPIKAGIELKFKNFSHLFCDFRFNFAYAVGNLSCHMCATQLAATSSCTGVHSWRKALMQRNRT